MPQQTVHIIGGGIGGLSAAISLAGNNIPVELYEQQAQLGGKANSLALAGFRFDTGPSLLTLPSVFSSLFSACGKKIEDYIPIVALSPLTNYWFSDGTTLFSDRWDTFMLQLESNLQVSRKELLRYYSYTKKIWDLTHEIFLEKSLHDTRTYLNRRTLSSLLQFKAIDTMRSMHKANATFFKDPRMIQLLDRYATYNGSDPYQAPATLNNICYVEHGLGGFGVKNGIYGIIQGMERLAGELGVQIHTQSKVDAIQCNRNGSVSALTIGNQEIPANTIISDVDVLTLYSTLLHDPKAPLATRYRRLPPSSSALVFYWGIDRTFPQLGLHNIFFSKDYKKEFHAIHMEHRIEDDSTIYINITSKITPSDAPEGQENWFVLVNAPYDDGRNWELDIAQKREQVIRKLSTILSCDLSSHIVAEASMSPSDIASQTGSFRGSLYGISSNTSMAAFLRHRNVSKRHPGLYLVGGSVHPGGGMPLTALSGKIVSEAIIRRSR